jgi:epoxyqueuosine reductase
VNAIHQELTHLCKQVGLDGVGVAKVKQPTHHAQYLEWIDQGMHGEMNYMQSRAELRGDPSKLLTGAKSLLCFSWNYHHQLPARPLNNSVKIARYAQGDDYHTKFKEKLRQFWQLLATKVDLGQAKARFFVDSAPIMERDFAADAGLGWIGKNTCLIDTKLGSWLFLGEILTDFEFEATAPLTDHCGICTACIDACPTDALRQPYVLDANRCISYLTIEKRSDFDDQQAAALDDWVFGCDICQDVCPWNRKAPFGTFFAESFRSDLAAGQLATLQTATDEEFEQKFEKTPLLRTGRSGMQRNLEAAENNLKNNKTP